MKHRSQVAAKPEAKPEVVRYPDQRQQFRCDLAAWVIMGVALVAIPLAAPDRRAPGRPAGFRAGPGDRRPACLDRRQPADGRLDRGRHRDSGDGAGAGVRCPQPRRSGDRQVRQPAGADPEDGGYHRFGAHLSPALGAGASAGQSERDGADGGKLAPDSCRRPAGFGRTRRRRASASAGRHDHRRDGGADRPHADPGTAGAVAVAGAAGLPPWPVVPPHRLRADPDLGPEHLPSPRSTWW